MECSLLNLKLCFIWHIDLLCLPQNKLLVCQHHLSIFNEDHKSVFDHTLNSRSLFLFFYLPNISEQFMKFHKFPNYFFKISRNCPKLYEISRGPPKCYPHQTVNNGLYWKDENNCQTVWLGEIFVRYYFLNKINSTNYGK